MIHGTAGYYNIGVIPHVPKTARVRKMSSVVAQEQNRRFKKLEIRY